MTVVIKNKTTITFSMNGIDYQKNYTPLLNGNNIMIISAYDSKQVILKSTPFGEFEINGVVPSSASVAMTQLISLVFTKDIVSPGGASKSSSMTLQLYNSIEGVNHSASNNQPLSGNIIVDMTGAVENGFATVLWNTSGTSNPNITITNGAATLEFKNDITEAGTYEITIAYRFGKVQVFIPSASIAAGGGSAPNAPSLSLSEYTFTIGAAPNAPSLSLTEYTF